MNVASPDTVFLFNYRGASEELNKLVFISGRRDPSGQLRDGAKVLKNILDDAVEVVEARLKVWTAKRNNTSIVTS